MRWVSLKQNFTRVDTHSRRFFVKLQRRDEYQRRLSLSLYDAGHEQSASNRCTPTPQPLTPHFATETTTSTILQTGNRTYYFISQRYKRVIPTPNVEFSRRGREGETGRKGKVKRRSIIREMMKRRDPRYFLDIYLYHSVIRCFHTYHLNHIINLFIHVFFLYLCWNAAVKTCFYESLSSGKTSAFHTK